MGCRAIHSVVHKSEGTTRKGEVPPGVGNGAPLPPLFLDRGRQRGHGESICKNPEGSVACSLSELMKERTKVKRRMAQALSFHTCLPALPSDWPTSTRHQGARQSH